jgi:lipoprotein-anchoring transpeptidase ErfK/SrfK
MKTLLAIVATGVLQLGWISAAYAESSSWTGSIDVPNAIVYDTPGGTPVTALSAGANVTVTTWVSGPQLTSDNYTWAELDTGRFVHSSTLKHAPLPASPPVPPRIVSSGHWADANLTQQILTLYDGSTPTRIALMSSGRPGADTESHPGIWPIQRRVADETMRGDGYDIAGVLYTQYFTDDNEAIHLNYWLADDERGIPRSHGCLGLTYADAAFAWRFLDVGSLVYVHA